MKKIYDSNDELFAELNYGKEYFSNFNRHSHETFVISVIGSGEIEVEFHLQAKTSFSPGQIVVFNPNQVHATKSKTKTSLNYYSLYINAQWYKNNVDTKPLHVQNIIAEQNLYHDLVNSYNEIILNNQKTNNTLEKTMKHILKKYLAKMDYKEDNEYEKVFFENVEKYILDNLKEQITLEDIAKAVDYNESYITRVFKKRCGLSPHAYLVNKRVEKAKRKLFDDKDIDLAELSNEIGFYDQSHFSKAFKRVLAITPNKYKKE